MTDKVLMVTPLDSPGCTPGTSQINAGCGHRAWISASGVCLLLGGGFTTVCTDCVNPDELTELVPVPGTRKELAAMYGLWAADGLIAKMRNNPVDVLRTVQKDSRRRRGEP